MKKLHLIIGFLQAKSRKICNIGFVIIRCKVRISSVSFLFLTVVTAVSFIYNYYFFLRKENIKI